MQDQLTQGKDDKETQIKKRKKENLVPYGETYKVRNKDIPDSKQVQGLILDSKQPIETKIIDYGKNDEKAWANIECIHRRTGQITIGAVCFHFNTHYQVMLLDLIKDWKKYNKGNPIGSIDQKTGEPILTSEAAEDLWTRFIRFKQFAERIAITQASRQSQLKMLNQEFREHYEIDFEKEEKSTVETMIKTNKGPTTSSNSSIRTSTPTDRSPKRKTPSPIPNFPEPEKQDLAEIDIFHSFLLDQTGIDNEVFPPTSLKHLSSTAKRNKPFQFLIRLSKYKNMIFQHWPKDDDTTVLTVQYPPTLAIPLPNITIFLKKYTGELIIANVTKENFGDFLVPILRASGYGQNWWLAPESVYNAVKHLKNQKKTK